MADLVIHGIEPALAERIRCVAIARGWTYHEAVIKIIERGLFMGDYDQVQEQPIQPVNDALADAISMLEKFPNRSGL